MCSIRAGRDVKTKEASPKAWHADKKLIDHMHTINTFFNLHKLPSDLPMHVPPLYLVIYIYLVHVPIRPVPLKCGYSRVRLNISK